MDKEISVDFGASFLQLLTVAEKLRSDVLKLNLTPERTGLAEYHGKGVVSQIEAQAVEATALYLQEQLAKYRAAQVGDPGWQSLVTVSDAD